MFLKAYVGQYYRDREGELGEEPINMIFRAISSYIPALVMQNPRNTVGTDYRQFDTQAKLIQHKLDESQEAMRLKQIYRAWLVDAFFGFGIMKTGLKDSGYVMDFEDSVIDPGEQFSDIVDLDNFTFDPSCEKHMFRDAFFTGDLVTVERQALLDDDRFDHDLVMQLPEATAGNDTDNDEKSRQDSYAADFNSARDMVTMCELWIPSYDQIVYTPDPRELIMPDYIGTAEYDGIESGPYEYLSFSPPVNDCLPIAPVGMWYDLHVIANDMFKKTMDQAERQKDIGVYKPAHADEADDIRDAEDGDMVASTDPDAVKVLSFGGQKQTNEIMLSHLHTWFNYVTGNADLVGGSSSAAPTATQAEMLQANQSISIEDAKTLLYDAASNVSKRHAYYIWTNPMEFTDVDKEDFLFLTFKIKARSMQRLDPAIKTKRIIDFMTQLVPATVQSGMMMQQMGRPFNVQVALTQLAEDLDIADWFDGVFDDPEYLDRMMLQHAMSMKSPGNSGNPIESESPGGGLQTNGQPGIVGGTTPSSQEFSNMQAQQVAGEAQSARLGVM
jgi:hypothetical protein